jgi:pimeloyl-ACP methyl ester carboxylesterase
LAQWGDDVRGFCEALGIAHPIVFGASFGGMVAMAYATPHPDHPAKLILVSTEAAGDTYLERRVALFERFGGPEVGALARRRFLDGHTATATLDTWLRLAFPFYTRTPRDPRMVQRAVRRPEITGWFTRPGGEVTRSTCFPRSHAFSVQPWCWAGRRIDDPIECQAEIAAALSRAKQAGIA